MAVDVNPDEAQTQSNLDQRSGKPKRFFRQGRKTWVADEMGVSRSACRNGVLSTFLSSQQPGGS